MEFHPQHNTNMDVIVENRKVMELINKQTS